MPREESAAQKAIEEVAADLDRQADAWLARAEAGEPEGRPACRRGCAFCCHQLVPLTTIEAQRIADYLARQPRNDRRDLLDAVDRQAKRFTRWVQERRPENVQDRATNLDYLRQGIPCPFLGKEKECRIYPVRPLICRGHHALGTSQSCETGEREIRSIPALDQATAAAMTEARNLTSLLGAATTGGLISTFAPLFRVALRKG